MEAEVKEKMYLDAIQVLQFAGVEKFTPEVGEQLDMEKHSVVHLVLDLKNPPGMIVQVFEEGYICNGRILRRAKTDKRFNLLQAKPESFQNEAEVKDKMYLDAIEVLQFAGVEKFTPEVGEQLDMEKHSVVHLVLDLKNPPGMIVQVFEEGYICNGRILRRAKVGVSRAVETRGRSKNA
ncbi:uncharacterized protein LOC113756355 [Coffea eugenioides]|uniref:uncharacterized protein LOC113756355 n=1 Tax=Coffea eugenioides TaxID=49369 RepID=UPI000F612F74|nr:uncharacterized protein LOC113756355 [Coffea eugenioides]